MNTPPNTTVNNHRLIAFTTPETYAVRLTPLIHLKGWTPLWCPTITTTPTNHTRSSLLHHLSLLNQFSAIAFTSRSGISAFSDALSHLHSPPYNHHQLTVCALGNDSQLINNSSFVSKLCNKGDKIKILVPEVATPEGMVGALGMGFGRKVMCPVPKVVGLEEPTVVPDFIRDLGLNGWVVVRVDAYETRWLGEECAAALVVGGGGGEGGGVVDAVVFTSTGEVEGMLKSLKAMGFDWGDVVKRNPGMVVAAHGPVTAAGTESLGVGVDVVGSRFGSFDGVVDALAHFWDHS